MTTDKRIRELAAAYLGGGADEAEVAELERLLMEDASAARIFACFCQQEVALADVLQGATGAAEPIPSGGTGVRLGEARTAVGGAIGSARKWRAAAAATLIAGLLGGWYARSHAQPAEAVERPVFEFSLDEQQGPVLRRFDGSDAVEVSYL